MLTIVFYFLQLRFALETSPNSVLFVRKSVFTGPEVYQLLPGCTWRLLHCVGSVIERASVGLQVYVAGLLSPRQEY